MNVESKASEKNVAVNRVVMFHGEVRLELDSWAFYLYYPRIIKTNVDIGLQADTRLLVTWFNKWSEYKSKSVAIKVLGFGFGIRKDYD